MLREIVQIIESTETNYPEGKSGLAWLDEFSGLDGYDTSVDSTWKAEKGGIRKFNNRASYLNDLIKLFKKTKGIVKVEGRILTRINITRGKVFLVF